MGNIEDLDHRSAPQCDDRSGISEPADVDPNSTGDPDLSVRAWAASIKDSGMSVSWSSAGNSPMTRPQGTAGPPLEELLLYPPPSYQIGAGRDIELLLGRPHKAAAVLGRATPGMVSPHRLGVSKAEMVTVCHDARPR